MTSSLLALLALAALSVAGPPAAGPPQPIKTIPGSVGGDKPIKVAPRIREGYPVRLGGVFLRGLSEREPADSPAADSAHLSSASRDWLVRCCDVAALDRRSITPETFPAMRRAQRLFTPLLYLLASTLYESDDHRANVGGWTPAMKPWTLKDAQGQEVRHPDAGGHWMDFGSTEWAAHWRDHAIAQAARFGAFGAVAAEMPPGNSFVPDSVGKYRTFADRVAATEAWLAAAHAPGRYLLIPSSVGFGEVAGHGTPPTPPGTLEPELSGRVWDALFSVTDGAWAEGWVRPYWADGPLPESAWELDLEAADRAGRSDQVFIACAAYSNAQELEYALASYLLVAHHQGRVVFQPMPLARGARPDAGLSLAVARREVEAHAALFNVPLGVGVQERHQINVQGGTVWRRAFELGAVYVNSHDSGTVTVALGGPMRRATGELVRSVALPPHSGVILLDLPEPSKHGGSAAGSARAGHQSTGAKSAAKP